MRFWGSPKAACYTTTHSPYRLTNEPSKKGHSVLVKYSRKTDAVLSESQASTDQLQPVWQACLCLQPLPPCEHHQWIPSLLNPHTPSCALQGEGQTLRASVCLCLHLPWDQDSNDNMAEVASTQPQGWEIPDITGGLLLQAWRGEGGVPSGLCPPAVPGHHQHGPAHRNHHPGRAHGDRGRAAQGVGNNLGHKTKSTSELEGLRWAKYRNDWKNQFSGA